MTRFIVGETYTFARALFTAGGFRFTYLYCPWEDELHDIEVINVVCTKHHKVPWDQDPNEEKKYDGFLFHTVGNESEVWGNQYPMASYGQVDDSNDYRIRRYFTDEELFVFKDGEVIKGEDGLAITKDIEKWETFKRYYNNPLTLATTFIGPVHRAINPKADRFDPKFTPEQKEAMIKYEKQLRTKIEEVSGKKITYAPVIFTKVTGETTAHPDYEIAYLGP